MKKDAAAVAQVSRQPIRGHIRRGVPPLLETSSEFAESGKIQNALVSVEPPNALANLKAADASLSSATERLGRFVSLHFTSSGDAIQLMCESFEQRQQLDNEYAELRKSVERAHGVFQLALARWAAEQ